MGRPKRRKPPEMPYWWWLGQDGCLAKQKCQSEDGRLI